MVRFTNNRKKSAFTMIELIFAIVVIAISVMSLPMVTQVTQKGIESNIVQEAIFAASSELIGATAGYWDEKSVEDSNNTNLSKVINISGDCDNITKLRPGHINQLYHRRCLDDNSSTGLDATANTAIFSLDDAAALVSGTAAIFDNPIGELEGYKDTYTSTLTISRTNNIKFLELEVKNSDSATITKLKMQSANIGEIDYYKRLF